MKKICLFALLIIFPFCFSNGQNRLKMDEKELSKQIIEEEEIKEQEAEAKKQREAEERKNRSQEIPFKEESRKPDLQNPPVVIDIIGNREKPQSSVKLSQFFDRIEYVRLEMDPDSLLGKKVEEVFVTKNHIYSYSYFHGILQYDRRGRFQQYVCKSKPHYNGKMFVADKFVGACNPYIANGKLHYEYNDYEGKKFHLMQFDEDDRTLMFEMPSVESERSIIGKGKIMADLPPYIHFFSSRSKPFIIAPDMVALTQTGKRPNRKNPLMMVKSSSNETLCAFQDYEPVENFSRSVYHVPDGGMSYLLGETLHLRQSFNDTVYQLQPPNRLIPKYILNLGEMGVDANKGVDPYANNTGKILMKHWLETSRYIFVTYVKYVSNEKDNEKSSQRFNRLVYDKQNKKTTVIYVDEKPFVKEKSNSEYAPEINVENDIDGTFFKWPEEITYDGKPCIIVPAEELQGKTGADFPIKNISEKDVILAVYH